MRLGIDASNSRAGGGLTYLIELLSHGNPAGSGINEVIIWASYYTLSQLPDKSWLVKRSHPLLNRSFFFRMIWQKFYLSPEAAKNCDILFLPSGNTAGLHP